MIARQVCAGAIRGMVTDETRIKWVQRIADVLSGAAAAWPERVEGADERYAEIREDMKEDAELWAALPDFIRRWSSAGDALESMSSEGLSNEQNVRYIQTAFERSLREFESLPVSDGFKLDAHGELGPPPEQAITPEPMTVEVSLGSPSLISPSPTLHRVVNSSAWTGRRTAAEQASYVRELVPDAVAAIDSLITEQAAMRRHNHPPEALEDEQLAALRALRDALTDLLDAVERGRPIEGALGQLRGCIGTTFGFAKDTGRLILANAPAVGAASVFGWATYAIATMVAGIEPGVAAAMAAGKMTVSAIKSKP